MRKEGRAKSFGRLETLSPEHKTAIVLRDIRGFSYEEIAEMTDTALGTVKSLHFSSQNTIKGRNFKN